jgi:hypothetical protein
MPSTTLKQARTMAGAAHNPAFAAKMGIAQKVAKEFNKADAKTGILRKKRKGGFDKAGVRTGSDGGVGGR